MDSIVVACAFALVVQHLPTGQCTTWSCDFESRDLCGYTQDTTDNLDWNRHAGDTPTPNTGPSVDHTLGTGYYMYLETSTGSPGEVARLVSTPFPASSTPYCLRFYYHMFGDSIDTLNVYIRKQGILGTPVWTLSGNQGNAWTLGHAQLDGSSVFSVVFEAVRGNGFRGDIAIDDVTVSDDCVPIATTVLPTTTPYPLASPSCTFELSPICGYRQDIHDSADWTWHQDHTDTDDTGPGFDHTLGTVEGHYMYFEASSIASGVTARLLSPTLPIIPSSSSHTSYCVTFWYHMYGLHIDTLSVHRKESGGSEVPMWSLSDGQGNVWRQGQLPLDGTTESTLVFEAVRGISYRGDIAIDDVDVIQYRGQCDFIPASAMVHLPSTTTQSPSTSAYLPTSETPSAATTTEQPPTATPTETPSKATTIATGPSSTTESIPSATSAITPLTPTITAQSFSSSTHFTTSVPQSADTAATPTETSLVTVTVTTWQSSTTEIIPSAASSTTERAPAISTQSSSTSTYLSTSGTLHAVTTTGQSPTAMSTETSSTAATIATGSSSTTGRPTTLQSDTPTSGMKTTAGRTSTETGASSTIATAPNGSWWTPDRPEPSQTTVASDSPPTDVKTDGTTPKSARPTVTSFTQSSRITGPVTTAGGDLSAGQTGSTTTIIVAVAVVLSLVCGAVAGVVATVCYKKKKRTRSGHAKVKYATEQDTSASVGHALPNGRVEFENPTFEHIYEELPNVVANVTSRQDQRPLSAISSSQTEVYMEINDDENLGAKASPAVQTANGDDQMSLSSNANVLFPSPRQVDQRGRRHDGHRERNITDEHTRQEYRRDSRERESDYFPPISDPNMHGPNLNHIGNNYDDDYERIRHDHYQDLNPRPPAHYQSLRPDPYQKLNVPEHAPNPDGYQSLRHNHHQHLDVPTREQNPDGYQSLRHNQYQNLPPHSQNDRPPYV
ncbi:zonadhesin-like [Branchiostoma floridae]|uniref:Zonadhesin-like n=2 Tax=Branchiostoma floridae TaxID=7739 RepID=A0A9J7N3P0_BRAFL|nr:zonadhesin-like [Branchiostoma floridae]